MGKQSKKKSNIHGYILKIGNSLVWGHGKKKLNQVQLKWNIFTQMKKVVWSRRVSIDIKHMDVGLNIVLWTCQ